MVFRPKSPGCVAAAIQNSCNHSVACAEVWLELISSDMQLTAVLHLDGSKEDAKVLSQIAFDVVRDKKTFTPGEPLAVWDVACVHHVSCETDLYPSGTITLTNESVISDK